MKLLSFLALTGLVAKTSGFANSYTTQSKNILKAANLYNKRFTNGEYKANIYVSWKQAMRCMFGCTEEYNLIEYQSDSGPVFVFFADDVSYPDNMCSGGFSSGSHQLHFGYTYTDAKTVNGEDIGALFFVVHPNDWRPFQKRFASNTLTRIANDGAVKVGASLGTAAAGAAAGAAMGSIIPIAGTAVGGAIGAIAGFVGGVIGTELSDRFAGDYMRYIGGTDTCGPMSFSMLNGDGVSDREVSVGYASDLKECKSMVWKQEPSADGMTMSKTTGRCYAEFGWRGSTWNGDTWSTDWETLKFGNSKMPGDGISNSETKVGVSKSYADCIRMVNEAHPSADGATVDKSGVGDCYAEFGWSGSNGSAHYETFKFFGKLVNGAGKGSKDVKIGKATSYAHCMDLVRIHHPSANGLSISKTDGECWAVYGWYGSTWSTGDTWTTDWETIKFK